MHFFFKAMLVLFLQRPYFFWKILLQKLHRSFLVSCGTGNLYCEGSTKGWSSTEDLEVEYSNTGMYLKDFINRELCSMKELNKVLSDCLQMLCRPTEYTTVWTCNCTKSLFFSFWSSRNASGTWKNLVLLCLPVWGCFIYNLKKSNNFYERTSDRCQWIQYY